jgi:pantoate--beta-alanine ligase
MSDNLPTVRQVADLRACIADWRAAGLSVGLVPTMGALHEGHFSLVRRCIESMDRTCVTLFVNPKQFGAGEDLDAYPRGEDADAVALAGLGAHLMFAPGTSEMYPPGSMTQVSVHGLGDWLEGEFRPGFFTGVATVVTKLLLQALPDAAFFGEKDYQQLCVVRRLAADLDIPVEIVGCPIIRETDGLAMSSRNAYLNAGERASAPALHQALTDTAKAVRDGNHIAAATEAARGTLLKAGFTEVDYVAVRDADALAPVERFEGNARVLGAAWLGITRLIDNLEV